MKRSLLIIMFIAFLKEENALIPFVVNLKPKYRGYKMKTATPLYTYLNRADIRPSQWVDRHAIWHTTKDGIDWGSLNNKWNSIESEAQYDHVVKTRKAKANIRRRVLA